MRPVLSASSLVTIGPVSRDSNKAADLSHCAQSAGDMSPETKRVLHDRSRSLLTDALQGVARGNVLTISHPSFPFPECDTLSPSGKMTGVTVGLYKGDVQVPDGAETPVQCGTRALPFQDEAFRTVVLFHVIATGNEPELQEACRVLTPGGDLVVVGLNWQGWSAQTVHRRVELPRIRHGRLLGTLRKNDMEVIAELGMGLMGRPRPRMDRDRWTGLALAFADLLLLRIRHRDCSIPTPLRLEKFPARVMPTSLSFE